MAKRPDEGVVTAYTGAWVDADAGDASCAVQPAKRPNHRPKKGMVWNGKAHAMRNAAGIIIAYAGEYVLANVVDASSDIGSDDLEDESSGVGNKRSRREYPSFLL